MTQDQLLAALRQVLTLAGGIAVGRGWITADILTAALGALPFVVSIAWSIAKSSPKAQKAAVVAQSDVASITKTDGTVITTSEQVK